MVDPLGDLDADSFGNLAEVTAGSSPFDPQSTPVRSVKVTGSTAIGSTARISVLSTPGTQVFVAFAHDVVSPGLTIPGLAGTFLLDPATTLPVGLLFTGTSSLTIAMPTSTASAGRTVYAQGLDVTQLAFTNAFGILFH